MTAYVFLAEGFEEVEALTPVDILRRGGVTVKTVGIGGKTITGAHGIPVGCDIAEEDVIPDEIDMMVLPGGMPGATHLREHDGLCTLLKTASAAGSRLAAICAAPFILGELGLLEGREATCYPGFEDALTGAKLTGAGVVTDGNITTARGLGYALDLGIELALLLVDRPVALQVKDSIQYDQV